VGEQSLGTLDPRFNSCMTAFGEGTVSRKNAVGVGFRNIDRLFTGHVRSIERNTILFHHAFVSIFPVTIYRNYQLKAILWLL
jgi:hypothetical protein